MRVRHQVLDVLFQAHVQMVHHRRVRNAHEAEQIHLHVHARFVGAADGALRREVLQREAEHKPVLPAVFVHPLALLTLGEHHLVQFVIAVLVEVQRESQAGVIFARAGQVDALLCGGN